MRRMVKDASTHGTDLEGISTVSLSKTFSLRRDSVEDEREKRESGDHCVLCTCQMSLGGKIPNCVVWEKPLNRIEEWQWESAAAVKI